MQQTIELQHEAFTAGLKEYFQCDGHRRVTWTINGDGTATSKTDRLMWIQAPWGMRWEAGSKFLGEPRRLSWLDAARFFGRGVPVGLSDEGTIALSARQIRSTRVDAGYKRGEMPVHFAGHNDWRLPTVAEWHSIIGLEWGKCEAIFPFYRRDERHWSATMRKEVFGEREEGFFGFLIREKNRLAWAGNPGRSIMDCGVLEQHQIMLVRTCDISY